MVRLRRVSLERRHGNLEEAEALLQEAMESAKNATETSFYAVKLARQMMKVQRSLSKARKVLLDAIEKDQVRTDACGDWSTEFSQQVLINLGCVAMWLSGLTGEKGRGVKVIHLHTHG